MMLLLTTILVLPSQVHAGSFGKDGTSGTPGQWYVGDVIGEIDPDKSPVLFVHGLNSSSTTWWDGNDMYETLSSNGFETAFIDLSASDDMWGNGELLAQKLQEIHDYFGEKVVVVAHSKGGVDVQSALVHYGAHPYVERVITLSAPHKGSELADLAHSNWAGWLADILGNRNDATYSLQTGYMSYFRSETDQHPNVSENPLYTFGGTGWGPFWGSLFYGGMYLRQFGQNDGAVTVSSSRLPYAQEIKVDDWDHYEIKEGSSTFSLFEPYLYEDAPLQSSAVSNQMDEEKVYSSYHRGGKYKQKAAQSFYIEDGVEEVAIQWISNSPATHLSLESPSRKSYTTFQTGKDDSDIFKGAYQHMITLRDPKPGLWQLTASNPNGENYFMQIDFESNLNNQMDVQVGKNNKPELEFQSKQPMKVQADIRVMYYKNGKSKSKKVKIAKKQNQESVNLKKLGEGVYNVTIDLKGKTKKGYSFNRTVIDSVYIDDQGNIYH